MQNGQDSIQIVNANLLFYHGLAKLSQIPYCFEFILSPAEYPSEWKQILSVLLDFLEFKQSYAPKHLELQQNILSAAHNLEEVEK